MSFITKALLTIALIVASTLAGYVARRRNLVSENVAKWGMTAVVVFGYSPVSFFTIWSIRPQLSDIWLPVLGGAQVVLMGFIGMLTGGLLGRDRRDTGLLGLTGAVGNTGFTMGGIVLFLLFGEPGLGRGSIYALMWYPMMVVVLYPIGRYFSGHHKGSLAKLMLTSLFNWRSIGLPVALTGLALSLSGVPRPQVIKDCHIVPIIMYVVIPMAYFSIGLRLHFASIVSLRKFIAALGCLRFLIAPGLAVLMVLGTRLTAYPLAGLSRDVLLVNSCVPTAITAVAVANMFHLKPRDASMLFVTNTLTYLAIVLPVVLWIFTTYPE